MKQGAQEEPRAGYLGFVAHEIRNPLTTALWCAELLGRIPPEERGGARGEKLAAMALRSLRRVSTLLEDHLLAERLSVEGIPLRLEPVPLREVLAEAGGRAAPAGGLQLSVPDGMEVRTDRALLVQLLECLIGAAGRDGAAVRVEVPGGGAGLRLAVSGAAQPDQALALPSKGMPTGGALRPLGLVLAVAAARALGLSLRIDRGVLELAWPAGDVGESPGAAHP